MEIQGIALGNYFSKAIDAPLKNEGISFSETLRSAVDGVKQLELIDQKNSEQLAIGRIDSLHKLMIDMEKSHIALQFTLQIRNKLIEAYQEIMRMQM